MADSVPSSLKAADISRFAHRASQLEKHMPVIAYWCKYWIISQILAKSLHQTDDEALEYTTTLMDNLEQTKKTHADVAAITNDVDGNNTCREFAQQVFDRAERAIDASRVTRQTADTFQAAATFFELANIWGTLDRETQAKIKYAKWNAARILKAVREGKDPNDSNPRRQKDPGIGEEEGEEGAEKEQVEEGKKKKDEEEVDDKMLPALDPNDPEVRLLMGNTPAESAATSTGFGAHNVNAPSDSSIGKLAGTLSTSSHSSKPPPVLPLQSSLPSRLSDHSFFNSIPSAPSGFPNQTSAESHPSIHHLASPQTGLVAPSLHASNNAGSTPMHSSTALRSAQTPTLEVTSSASSFMSPPAGPSSGNGNTGAEKFTTDEAKMGEASKHARWAISALNFEDVPTAVKELRIAIDNLLE